LFAVNNGYMDDLDIKKVLSFEAGLHAHLKDKHATLLAKLEDKKAMDDEAKAELTAATAEFKKTGSY
jgi:F-type H+-transporting ATPase subunit alpha